VWLVQVLKFVNFNHFVHVGFPSFNNVEVLVDSGVLEKCTLFMFRAEDTMFL
jgi:hypothetical protein